MFLRAAVHSVLLEMTECTKRRERGKKKFLVLFEIHHKGEGPPQPGKRTDEQMKRRKGGGKMDDSTGRIGLQYPRVVNATPHSVLLLRNIHINLCRAIVIHGFNYIIDAAVLMLSWLTLVVRIFIFLGSPW